MRAIALLLTLLPFLPAFADEPRKRVIVCSTTQIADFTRQIVGDRCVVKCILAPGADPHTYMPTPGDAEIAATADLCLENGLHLEGKNWMATLAKDRGKPIGTCTEGLAPLELEAGGQKIHDPHAWFSPANAAKYVNNIVAALSKLDPAGIGEFEARAKLYLQQLRTLDAWIKEQFNAILPEKRILVTSHDAFNYFCRDYGFKSAAPVGWSTGNEVGAGMTPERRKAVVDSIRSFGVKAVFVETSVNPKMVEELASEAGVAVGGQLYSDSMGGPGTAGETYIGMMRENVLTIVRALK
ncbi:MAG: ABC-type metal ion transport system periplasmic component/surface [Planctomycetota bacterium]|nr:MAG: ABC-type metal ion transport system periplasmic component/surface [Planctomycetota bacterium]